MRKLLTASLVIGLLLIAGIAKAVEPVEYWYSPNLTSHGITVYMPVPKSPSDTIDVNIKGVPGKFTGGVIATTSAGETAILGITICGKVSIPQLSDTPYSIEVDFSTFALMYQLSGANKPKATENMDLIALGDIVGVGPAYFDGKWKENYVNNVVTTINLSGKVAGGTGNSSVSWLYPSGIVDTTINTQLILSGTPVQCVNGEIVSE